MAIISSVSNQALLSTSSPTFNVLTLSTALAATSGGTGVANLVGSTITLGGAFAMSGAYTFTGTLTNNTSVTFPTSGTLATTGSPGTLLTAAASGSTQAAAVNTIYYVTASGGCVITLPATAAAGSIVGVVGDGAGGWTLDPNSGQTIKIITASASTSVASAEAYDCIFVMCVVANTTWVAYSAMTTGFTYS